MADTQKRSEGKKRKSKADRTDSSKKAKQDEGKGKQTCLSAFGFECAVADHIRKPGEEKEGEPQQPGPAEESDEKTFQEKWLLEFPWLTLKENGSMLCKTCAKHKTKSPFADEGSTNFQRSALTRHQKSLEHKSSATSATAHTPKIDQFAATVDETELDCMMDTVQMMVVEELPAPKFPVLIEHMVRIL